jgi:hypothetical protein
MNAVLAGDEAVALVETAGGIVLLRTVKLNMIREQDLCLGDERRTDAQSLPLGARNSLSMKLGRSVRTPAITPLTSGIQKS